MKTTFLTKEQYDRPENQNRDKAIIGYRSIEPKKLTLPTEEEINSFAKQEWMLGDDVMGKTVGDVECVKRGIKWVLNKLNQQP